MSSESALAIGVFAGYLALILYALWPTSHDCHDLTCRRLRDERGELKKGDKK